MKTLATMLALCAIPCIFAINVQSDEPTKTDDRPTFLTSPLGQELLDTLDLAFTQRVEEYNAGRSGPEHAIRLNQKLYDAQISAANGDSRRLIAENYVERAKQIEGIAKRSLDNGTGLSQQFLESKAAWISATLELAKFQRSP
jgi:hypothetical protein